jgi:hypothetical protein
MRTGLVIATVGFVLALYGVFGQLSGALYLICVAALLLIFPIAANAVLFPRSEVNIAKERLMRATAIVKYATARPGVVSEASFRSALDTITKAVAKLSPVRPTTEDGCAADSPGVVTVCLVRLTRL